MKVITTLVSADNLYRSLIINANEAAAELARDLLDFSDDIRDEYIEIMNTAIPALRGMAMEVLDMVEAGEFDEKRIIEIRAYAIPQYSKSRWFSDTVSRNTEDA